MNKFKSYAAIVVLSMLMVGCATTASTVEYKSVLITPPDYMLGDCKSDSPPNKETYLAGTEKDREKLLYEYSKKQTQNLSLCNEDKKTLREWKKKQVETYAKENPKTEIKTP